MFRAKGLPQDDAERIAEHVVPGAQVALDLMSREGLGLTPHSLGSPWGAATSSFAAFATGAAVPLLPYFVVSSGQHRWQRLASGGRWSWAHCMC